MAKDRTNSLTITIPEVAQFLGISRGLAYELAKQDKLPVKVLRLGGKRMVVSRKELEYLLSGKAINCENGRQSTI